MFYSMLGIDISFISLVFTDAFIADAFHLIVDKLLPLTPQDWETWQEDPEEWFVNQMDVGLAWSFDFRVGVAVRVHLGRD